MGAERRFRAMGTDVHLAVDGSGDDEVLARHAHALVDRLEARWSRFRPESELCRLNRAAGRPVLLEDDTFALVAAAVEAWQRTGGRFDPTVLPALEAAGYDRSFELVAPDGAAATAPAPVPGCAAITLDPVVGTVTLPAGVALDLGGIAKGHTADVVAEALLAAGAQRALVNVGGDLRVAGKPPGAGGWSIGIDDPLHPGEEAARLAVAAGGVATTSAMRRRWRRDGCVAHHVIDPATARPSRSPLASVTVVAGTARWAEVLAKAVFVAGPAGAAAVLAGTGAAALLIGADGEQFAVGGMEVFLR